MHLGGGIFTCLFYNATFSYAGNRRRHLRIHTGESPLACSVFNTAYSAAGHLMIHMWINTAEKIIYLSISYVAFSQAGEYPFTCSVCNAAYTQTGDMNKHMRVHTDKIFSQVGNFKRNIWILTGERNIHLLRVLLGIYRARKFKSHMRVRTINNPCS